MSQRSHWLMISTTTQAGINPLAMGSRRGYPSLVCLLADTSASPPTSKPQNSNPGYVHAEESQAWSKNSKTAENPLLDASLEPALDAIRPEKSKALSTGPSTSSHRPEKRTSHPSSSTERCEHVGYVSTTSLVTRNRNRQLNVKNNPPMRRKTKPNQPRFTRRTKPTIKKTRVTKFDEPDWNVPNR